LLWIERVVVLCVKAGSFNDKSHYSCCNRLKWVLLREKRRPYLAACWVATMYIYILGMDRNSTSSIMPHNHWVQHLLCVHCYLLLHKLVRKTIDFCIAHWLFIPYNIPLFWARYYHPTINVILINGHAFWGGPISVTLGNFHNRATFFIQLIVSFMFDILHP
jgi:hypothetical protein